MAAKQNAVPEIQLVHAPDWNGCVFKQNVTELDACLWAFRVPEEAKRQGWLLSKADTFWRICFILWPKRDGARVWVEPNPWGERIIQAACNHKLLAASGCSSCGKSFLLGAAWGLVNWLANVFETKVIITSQTVQGARNRVWKDISQLYYGALGIGLDKVCPAFKMLDATAQIKTDPKLLARYSGDLNIAGMGVSGMGIEIIAGGKGEASATIGKLQGMKAKRMIIIADELPLLEHGILEAAIGNLFSNKEAQLIGLGNFSSIYDPFGIFTEPVDGWKSLHEDIEGWETKPLGQRGYCLRFDGEKSPNVLAGYDKYPGIYSNEIHETHKKMGVKSAMYWKMCRSMPMPEGGDLSIYSEADFVAGDVHGHPIWDAGAEQVGVAFLDPAFTNGGDRSQAVFAKVGISGGRKTLEFTEAIELKSDVTQTWVPHDFQIARQYRDLCKARGIDPENAGFDNTGAGLSFGSILISEWSHRVVGVGFGGSASERPVSLNDSTTGNERYENRVAELWVQGREYVRAGQIKGMSKAMAGELLARQFPDPRKGKSYKKTAIESKRDMKSRVGYSPDLGDSGLGCIEVACSSLDFVPHGYGQSVTSTREESSTAIKDSDAVYDESCLLSDGFLDPVE